VSAESETAAATAPRVDAVAAVVDDVLADVADGEVGEILDVREHDGGMTIRMEAVEHADDPDRRVVSVAEITVDDAGEIVDVVRDEPDRSA
jgi:hypothetical protein